ncbi:hypothetical protein F5I97DRAFT_1300132 [Phlebopus sp. FC_14]|nr:hypothetical protein F5I97DRAFT_1300132 [Phlebopus sp. FC_14]
MQLVIGTDDQSGKLVQFRSLWTSVAVSLVQCCSNIRIQNSVERLRDCCQSRCYHAEVIQPYALRAPEVILGCGLGSSADIWDLGYLKILAHMPSVSSDEFDTAHLRKGTHFHQYFGDCGEFFLFT